MAKTVGIPDRAHSEVSSRTKRVGMMGELGLGYHRGQRHYRPHQQAVYMTAPTSRQTSLPNTLRNGGRPYMTLLLGLARCADPESSVILSAAKDP